MVLQGPGTIWESWTDTTNSHNHPALSATIAQYLHTLAGIELTPDVWTDGAPVRIRVDPGVAFELGSAEISVQTRAGRIAAKWSADKITNTVSMDIDIPHGITAKVHLPRPPACPPLRLSLVDRSTGSILKAGDGEVTVPGRGVLDALITDDELKVHVQNGVYQFHVSCTPETFP
jgi:hypothetical protein